MGHIHQAVAILLSFTGRSTGGLLEGNLGATQMKRAERMLGEAQKTNFKLTNSRYNVEVTSSSPINFMFVVN